MSSDIIIEFIELLMQLNVIHTGLPLFFKQSVSFQVVHNVGLCIALWDIQKLEDSYIFPGDGAHHTVGKESLMNVTVQCTLPNNSPVLYNHI